MKKFNVAKEERKLNRKNNIANNIKIRTIVLSIFVLVGSIMLFTYSKYSTSVNLDIMHSKVANFLQDDYIINAYVNGEEDDFPGKNDGYIIDEVVCNKGAIGTWDEDEWGLLITNATQEETECNVYFITPFDSIDFEFDPDGDGKGQEQTFTAPLNGKYKIELWGAQGGGDSSYAGGKGAYTSGEINLNKNEELFVYVGESTSNNYTSGYTADNVIYNNGTWGITWNSNQPAYGGGGSTDVRLVGGEWNDFDSLKTRIMVAAAGGGALRYYSSRVGADAGGLTGYDGTSVGSAEPKACGATQTSAGTSGMSNGTFGKAGFVSWGMSTGGNGWYPGGQGPHGSGTVGSGAGGSSFIAGYNGCKAIDIANSTSSSIVHKDNSTVTYNSKNYTFSSAIMIDGKGCTWSSGSATSCGSNQVQPNGTNATGHSGNGYARITLIERN